MKLFTGALAYHLVSLLALWVIPAVKAIGGDANLPPLEPGVRLVTNLLYVNAAASFFILLKTHEGASLPRWTWPAFGAVALVLCAAPPVFSGDLHEYLIRGRILGLYGESPYAHVPAEYPADPYYTLSTWKQNPDSYGPLFVILEAIPALVASESYLGSVWVLKAIITAFLGLSAWFFARLAADGGTGDPGRLLAAFALNPLLLVSTSLDGHNDTVMLAFTLGAAWFFLKKRYTPAFLFVTLGFLVKYTVLLILPVLAVVALRDLSRRDGRFPAAFVLKTAALNAAVVAAAFAPFWAGKATFLALIRASGWFYTNTLPYAFHRALELAGIGVPEAAVKYAVLGAFAAFYLAVLLAAARGALDEPKRFFRAVSGIYLAFYVTVTIPFGMHYLLWGLPWLVLARWPLENTLVTLYSFAGLFSYFKRMNFVLLFGAAVYTALLALRRFAPARKLA